MCFLLLLVIKETRSPEVALTVFTKHPLNPWEVRTLCLTSKTKPKASLEVFESWLQCALPASTSKGVLKCKQPRTFSWAWSERVTASVTASSPEDKPSGTRRVGESTFIRPRTQRGLTTKF